MSAFTGYIELFHVDSIFSSFYSRDETCTKDPVPHLLNFAIMNVYHKNDGQSIHLCVSKVKKTGVNIALDLSVEYYINSFIGIKSLAEKNNNDNNNDEDDNKNNTDIFLSSHKINQSKITSAFNTLNHVAVEQMQNLLFKFTRARDTQLHFLSQNTPKCCFNSNVNEYKIAAPIIFIALMPE